MSLPALHVIQMLDRGGLRWRYILERAENPSLAASSTPKACGCLALKIKA